MIVDMRVTTDHVSFVLDAVRIRPQKGKRPIGGSFTENLRQCHVLIQIPEPVTQVGQSVGVASERARSAVPAC